MRIRSLLLLVLPLGALLLFLVAVFLQPPRVITIDIGNEAELNAQGQGEHLYNFFGWGNPGTEKGVLARRIDPTASFMVPWAFRMSPWLALEVAMCGCGSNDAAVLAINGAPHTIELGDDWETYRFTVRRTPSIYHSSLYLEWQSDARPRPLVGQVTIQALYSPGIPLAALVVPLAVLLVFGVALEDAPLVHLARAAVVVGSAAAGRLLYAPQLLPFATLVALGGVAAVALTLLARDLRRWLVLWVLVLWLLALPQLLGTWVLDDAFISFRYAKNLVNGAGLTFNPGGEVVEGYTNFLWTIIMAGALALDLEPLVTAQALTLGLALATLLLVYRVGEAWWDGAPWSLLPPLLLAANPAFLLYTARGSGMETALVTLLALAAVWRIWRAHSLNSGVVAGMLCALLTMTRPDGALVPLAGGLVLLVQALRQGWRAPPAHALAGLVSGFIILYAPYFAWRYAYYGYPLPNTFYAKTGATEAQVRRGLAYTLEFVQSLGLRSLLALLALSALGLLRAAFGRNTLPGPAPLLWLFVLLTATYVTLVGGDHFPLSRFFVPVVPALALLLTHGAAEAGNLYQVARARWQGRQRQAALLIPAAAALAVALFLYVNISPLPRLDSRDPGGRIWGENRVALKNREIGYWFRFNTPPDTVVATAIAGAMPYYAERPVIDTLGLNDTYIAHLPVATMGQGVAGAEKTDLDYVLDRAPDYIPFATSGPYQELPRFEQAYELVRVRGPEGGEIELYYRKE